MIDRSVKILRQSPYIICSNIYLFLSNYNCWCSLQNMRQLVLRCYNITGYDMYCCCSTAARSD